MGKLLGIVFTGGEGPPPEKLKRLIAECKGETLLAAADSGLILAEVAGIKPDWIIGDMDSLHAANGEDRLKAYPAEKVIRHSSDKDFTDTELALALLWDKGCDEAWITGGGGGRLDHLLGIRDLFERERFPSRWITAAEDIYCIDAGRLILAPLEPAEASGNLVSVFPLGKGPWKAESAGLKWPLDNARWERGMYGISNVAVENEITINAKQGRFLIIQEGIWQRK